MLSMLIQINPFKYGGNYVYQLIQQWKTMNSVYRMLNMILRISKVYFYKIMEKKYGFLLHSWI